MQKIIRYRGATYTLVEAAEMRTAAKLIMYHGTSTGPNNEILHSILKEGLNPEAKKQSFDVQEDKLIEERSLESLGGVYFSVNPFDLRKFSQITKQKFGGNRLGVIAQIETRTPSVTIDEDDLFPLDLRRQKIADAYFRDVFHVVEASDYMLLNTMESGKLDYSDMAKWFVDNVLRKQWNISQQEEKRIVPSIAKVARLQVEAFLAGENARYQNKYWSNRHLFDKYGPKESPSTLFSQLKEATREALRIVRKAAEPSSVEYRRQMHKIRITEPVGYSGANRILVVFHWNDDWDRYKKDG
jgi:hypothetical protein